MSKKKTNKSLKKFKSAIITGMGRAIGMIIIYSLLVLAIKSTGVSIETNDLPTGLTSEITSTITK